jgi:hypothetical protein
MTHANVTWHSLRLCHFAQSVYLVMHWSDCHDQQSTMVLQSVFVMTHFSCHALECLRTHVANVLERTPLRFTNVASVATTLATVLSMLLSVLAQARLLRSFRRDTLRALYWQHRQSAEYADLVDAAELRHLQQVPNPFTGGKSLSLAAAPLLFGYAIINAIFFAFLVFATYIIVHMSVGVDIVRISLQDLLVPSGGKLVSICSELLLVFFRFFFFYWVHVVHDQRAVITQYRLFCYFDLVFFLVGYDVGLFMIGLRVVVSTVTKVFTVFRIDAPQLPGVLAGFDPLHNAYISCVMLEMNLQVEHRENELAAADDLLLNQD